MTLNWESPILFIDTYTGLLCFFIFLITSIFPPKKINALYGYRTKRSMKSEKNWNFAQRYSTKKMLKSTLLLAIFGLLGLFINWNENLEVAIGISSMTFALFYPIYLTEQALKKLENEDNHSN
tara:strand:+ start:649 stop:1017 length:369 start_codon:yes stop_codon:yes gene_type:complete